MKQAYKFFLLILLLAAAGCSKSPTPSLIEGKWIIARVYLLNNTSDDGKSYLEFTGCDTPPCPGIDYNSNENTTGIFTWELQDKTIIIADTMSEGGGYNNSWKIDYLGSKKMRLKADIPLFGEMTLLLKKQ
ncbi:MAG: hypothetical protein ABIJ16_02250 [Bacteroidota bacterium]